MSFDVIGFLLRSILLYSFIRMKPGTKILDLLEFYSQIRFENRIPKDLIKRKKIECSIHILVD